jgi:hypothetical protein
MASNNAFKITKDTSARKNTRVGSIQSAVEAAAMKESHDYYVERLTEGYKQQLETMEQTYEDQIRELKSQLTVSIENAKAEALKDAAAKFAQEKQAVIDKLHAEQRISLKAIADCQTALTRASKAEKDKTTLETRHRTQIIEQNRRHSDELNKAHRECKTGPYSLIEVTFVKRNKSNKISGASKSAVKRSGVKFSELIQAALKPHSTPLWGFEYKGTPLTNVGKTLTEVSECTSIVCKKPGLERY